MESTAAFSIRSLLFCFNTESVSLCDVQLMGANPQLDQTRYRTVPRTPSKTKKLPNIEVVLQELPFLRMNLGSQPHAPRKPWQPRFPPTWSLEWFGVWNLHLNLASFELVASNKLNPMSGTNITPSSRCTRRSLWPAASKIICKAM